MSPEPSATERPLEGVTVADFTVTLPGPYATGLLERMGARVIKFEPPGGDLTRGVVAMHDPINAGKQSVLVDLADEHDAALARRVACAVDVLVEGWRPGVAARLGLGYEDLRHANRRLVYCSISGYGAEGPLRERPGHDLNYASAAGMAWLLAGESAPEAMPMPIADLAGGTFAALRIAAALVESRTSGRGCFLDVSLTGAVRDWVEAIGDEQSPAIMLPHLPHYGVFQTADGEHLSLANAHEDHFWEGLCAALGLDEHSGLDFGGRLSRSAELRNAVSASVASTSRAALEEALASVDTCWMFVDPPSEGPAFGGMLPPSQGERAELDQHGAAIRTEFAAEAVISPAVSG